MPKSYGFLPEPFSPEHWHLGSGKASERFGAAPLNPTGDWTEFDPKRELQKRNGFETMNCTNFATGNALIALAKAQGFQDFPQNVSERYAGVMTGTTREGNMPHQVIETYRNIAGVIPDEVLPWTDDIETWEEYYHPNPMDEAYVALGQQILRKFTIGHEWVWTRRSTPRQKANLLKEALTRGTVCVSVRAWKRDGKKYTKAPGEDDNHWVWLVRYDGDFPVIRDQYSPFLKTLTREYDFGQAKLYFLSRRQEPLSPAAWLKNLLSMLWKS